MEHDLLTKAYVAFNAHDIDGVLTLMHPEVVWPNGMDGGYLEGKDAVREYWTRQWQLIDSHVEPQEFTTDASGHIAVEVHQIVHDLAGHLLSDEVLQHVYWIEDGLIRSMEIRNPKDTTALATP